MLKIVFFSFLPNKNRYKIRTKGKIKLASLDKRAKIKKIIEGKNLSLIKNIKDKRIKMAIKISARPEI